LVARWMVTLLLVAWTPGCKAGDGEPCAKNEDCAASLTCLEFKCVGIERMKQVKAGAEERSREEATRQQEAARAEAKRREDRIFCSSQYWVSHDRKQYNWCLDSGACTRLPGTGKCRVTNDADCERATGCQNEGECGHTVAMGYNGLPFHTCNPRNHRDCQSSQRCSSRRECFLMKFNEGPDASFSCASRGLLTEPGRTIPTQMVDINPQWQGATP